MRARRQFILLTAFGLGLLILAGELRAEMYQCSEPDGAVTFTNTPVRPGCRLLGGRRERLPLSAPSGDPRQYDDLISASSERYGVDPALVRAVVKAESNFNEVARSRKGAQGLMQLMPETARLYNIADAFNPSENIEAGVQHLRLLIDRYRGDLQLALAAYNAGIQAVEKYGGIPPFAETKEYVKRVLGFHQRYTSTGQLAVVQRQ
ncbi:MAG TPA: lytic transglycosylase domain-containing protein [Verrucomicrobiae bacterium]|jgi:soluble lytic murein transglycosylase-like protein|nr:lytic transglycosylase domain-containing protein [Verrucomicrobiae bacterium]